MAATSPDPSGEIQLDGAEHHLHPRMRIVWSLGGVITALVLLVIAVIVLLVTKQEKWIVVAVAVAVVWVLVVVLTVEWRWRCWSWSAWDDALELRHGMVSREASVVPYHRIQQIDVHRDPVERLLGLSTLILRTAAATSDAKLPGIAAEHADSLRHALLRRSGHDDAV